MQGITMDSFRGRCLKPVYFLLNVRNIALKIIQGYKDHNLKAGPWELPLIKRAVELGLGARSEAEYVVV